SCGCRCRLSFLYLRIVTEHIPLRELPVVQSSAPWEVLTPLPGRGVRLFASRLFRLHSRGSAGLSVFPVRFLEGGSLHKPGPSSSYNRMSCPGVHHRVYPASGM